MNVELNKCAKKERTPACRIKRRWTWRPPIVAVTQFSVFRDLQIDTSPRRGPGARCPLCARGRRSLAKLAWPDSRLRGKHENISLQTVVLHWLMKLQISLGRRPYFAFENRSFA